jgi:signal transduction histidine kinase
MKIITQKILYFISIIILGTICLQGYWNYNNYSSNKDRLRNEVQIAYDKSLETYFEEDSKETFISVISKDSTTKVEDLIREIKLDSKFGKQFSKPQKADSINTSVSYEFIETDENKKNTSLLENKAVKVEEISSIQIFKGKKAIDSIGGLEDFPSKITMSFKNDSIKYKMLDSIFKVELNRKNIALNYEIKHLKNDTIFYTYLKSKAKLPLEIVPNSAYFKNKETLNLNYEYSNGLLIKRIGKELLLSLLFSLAVIGCLFFLLYIIKKQKKIDEIKNDFINNITHEFKTPITTISTALEGMSTFNPENDIEKNKKYIAMSFNQLHKLENMVERILETATLNDNKLQLNIEKINLIPFIKAIIEKHKVISNKSIELGTENDTILINGDSFYLENVISNLIDNAIKYGGNSIKINCKIVDNKIVIDVIDDGNSILKSQEKIIFEKFYRIPKGNIHNVKGYGIGLYFAKNIIEKHNGTLELIRNKTTTFRITLPYAK